MNIQRTIGAALVIVCAAINGTPALAADLYKYKDQNGRWVFTDKKPADKNVRAEHSELLVTEARPKAMIVNRGSKERPKLVAVNPLAGPVQVWLELEGSDNIRVDAPSPYEWVVPAQSELYLASLSVIDRTKGWSYQWQQFQALGPPVDSDRVNRAPLGLPFAGGQFWVSQGFKGQASHNSHAEAYYAIDITMPTGTPIVAVRDGVVMDAERDYSRSGWNETFADEANYVRVLHADGSMAVYAHLDGGSIEVAVGQAVEKGQILARSGNTGYSTGPHLHFALQINQGRELVSLPFTMEGVGEPKVGTLMRAPASNVGADTLPATAH